MASTPRQPLQHPAAKPVVFMLALAPLAWLIVAASTERLGANPAEALIRSLGEWSLRLLLLTLAITPLRQALGQAALARFRRMLGLFSFFYVSLHMLAYAWLDMGLDLGDIAGDIAKRPFILMGFAAWVLMLPLAATSFNRAIQALGGQRWRRLHRLVHGLAWLAVAHFIWMRAGKQLFTEPAIYAALLILLQGWRLRAVWRSRPSAVQAP